MPIPRYTDEKTNIPYEIVLFCHACGWAIPVDLITENWKGCRQCGAKLITKRIDYPSREGAAK